MDADQLAVALAHAVEASKPATEYCFLWIDCWPMCMTKAEWSGWMQAIGSFIALVIATGLPFFLRCLDRREAAIRAWSESDLTIRFHSSLLATNEQLLRVALGNMPGAKGAGHPGDPTEVRLAINTLTPVSFENMRRISVSDPVLAKLLADFHTTLDTLVGVLQRNSERPLFALEKTLQKYLGDLDAIAQKIRERTVPAS